MGVNYCISISYNKKLKINATAVFKDIENSFLERCK